MFPKYATTSLVDGTCYNYINLHNPTIRALLTPYYISVACIVPACVMFYAYAAIWLTLKKSQTMQSQNANNESTTLRTAQVHLIQTCVILMVLFFVAWFQHAILFFLLQLNVVQDPYGYLYYGSVVLIYINCCLNPFVYSVRYESFQIQLKALFCK